MIPLTRRNDESLAICRRARGWKRALQAQRLQPVLIISQICFQLGRQTSIAASAVEFLFSIPHPLPTTDNKLTPLIDYLRETDERNKTFKRVAIIPRVYCSLKKAWRPLRKVLFSRESCFDCAFVKAPVIREATR